MHPLGATDVVSLAMQRTRLMLFGPWRFGLWWRMAVLALFTGEISGGSNIPNFNFRWPSGTSSSKDLVRAANWPNIPNLAKYLPLIIAAAIVVTVLYFVFLYISSVLHFVLFEAVLTGTTRLRMGWRRWRERAGSYFLFNLAMFFVNCGLLTVFAFPIYALYRAGFFSRASGLAIAGVVTVFAVGGIVLFGAILLFMLAVKDFAIPVMALEGLSTMQAWRRVWPMIQAEAKRYAGFYGLKLVLRLAAGVLYFIAFMVVMLIIAIPVVIVTAMVVTLVPGGAGISILMGVVIAMSVLVVGAVALTFAAFIGTPIAVFFQSYALQFFASRYDRLRALVYPPPPMPPPMMPPVVPLAPME